MLRQASNAGLLVENTLLLLWVNPAPRLLKKARTSSESGLSVGLESIDDLIADLDQALKMALAGDARAAD